MSNEEKTLKAIALWKELGITSANMEFSCGGDSMNDYSFTFFDDSGDMVESEELTAFFDDDVFRNVDFYVNSDGHYQGEYGNVEIELSDDEDEDFTYYKSSTSEWSESHNSTIKIKLTDEMVEFFNKYVLRFRGGYDEYLQIDYKRDFVMSDDEERILAEIENLLDNETSAFSPDDVEGDLEDWFTYQANEIVIVDNEIEFEIDNTITIYREE